MAPPGGPTRRADEADARADRADTARADADRERAAAEKAAARLEVQLEQGRARVGELGADRDRLATALTEATRARGEIPAAPSAGKAPTTGTPRARKGTRPAAPKASD